RAGARADEEALLERLVGDDGGPGVRRDQVVEEAVPPELDAEAEPDRQAGADCLLERGRAEQRAEAEDGPVAGARFGGQGERRRLLRPRRRGGEGQRPGEEQGDQSRGPTRTKKFTPSSPPPSGTAQESPRRPRRRPKPAGSEGRRAGKERPGLSPPERAR